MWCRTVDIGAHQTRCSLLQTLFMTAIAPPTMSTVTVRTINKGVFIATSLLRGQHLGFRLFVVQNEPTVNGKGRAKRLIAAQIAFRKGLNRK
jgi:hypothetical protein